MLKLVYSFFLGLLLVVFVGMGVASFYPSPKAPEYPASLETKAEFTEEDKVVRAAHDEEYKAYTERANDYNRNVAMIVLVAAVVLLVLGLALEPRANVLADGLLLGGTFTLLYSIGRSFAGDDPKYSFTVVSVGLIVTVIVGYMKFLQPQTKAAKKVK